MTDMETVGLYSSASKLTEVCLMLPLTFYVLMLPIAAKGYKEFSATVNQKLQAYTKELFILVFFIFGFGIIFSREILQLVYGENFLQAVWPLRILLVAYLIQCADMVLGMSCQAAGYHKFAMITAIIRALANIGLSFIFIFIWPLLGAAVATLISIILSFVIFQLFVSKQMNRFNWSAIILKSGLACLVTTILLFYFRDYMNLFVQLILYSLGYGGILLAIHRFSPIKVKYTA